MVNYNDSKIYTIKCNTTGLIYIGSTTQRLLSNRIGTHRSKYKKYIITKNKSIYITSFKILENNNYEYETIEYYNCDCKEDLLKRELYYIELYKNKYNNKVVNKCIPIITIDKKIYQRQQQQTYRTNNKEKLKEKDRKYYQLNKKEKQTYRTNTKDYQREYNKLYKLKKRIYKTPKLTKTFINNLTKIYKIRYNYYKNIN